MTNETPWSLNWDSILLQVYKRERHALVNGTSDDDDDDGDYY